MNLTRAVGALLVLVCALVTPARAGAPYGRYTVAADTVYDNKTQLTWQRGQAPPYASGAPSYTKAEALAYCPTLNSPGLGGFTSGWRLPTKKELETLVDPTVAITATQQAIDETAFPNTNGNYLTSTTYAAISSYSWAVAFVNGASFTTSTTDGFVYNVRCVH